MSNNIKKSATRFRTGEAANYIGISRRSFCDLYKRGEIPFYRLSPRMILFDKQDLDSFLDDHRIAV